jgi:Protein of unknown function (DUF1612)/HTH DNA binding domain
MSYTYEHRDLPAQARWKQILPLLEAASDTMVRFDERMDRDDGLAAGVQSRGHFGESCATVWLQDKLVHLEDLVLYDASIHLRPPSNELLLAAVVLRTRREICGHLPDWWMTEAGLATLCENDADIALAAVEPERSEYEEIDALLRVTDHLLEKTDPLTLLRTEPLADEHWDEEVRLAEWLTVVRRTEDLPPLLAAAFAWDAWTAIKPLRRRGHLGVQLVAAMLRARGKTRFHLPTLNVGIRVTEYRRRPHDDILVRLAGFLCAAKAASETGLKDLSRLSLAKQRMEARLERTRSSSRLPELIELFLLWPLVTVSAAAKILKVSPQAVEAMIKALGPALPREVTGKARYRAWGIF